MVDEQITQTVTLANIRVQEHALKAQTEIWKKQVQGNNEIALAKVKAQAIADVGSRRELQKLNVEIGEGGRITVKKEVFGGEIMDQSRFAVIEDRLLMYSISGQTRLVLLVRLLDQSSLAKGIFFPVEDCDERLINKKFTTSGISFGFSREKEVRVRGMLYAKLLETATLERIPPVHGWHELNGEIRFAFPEQLLTGEGVERYVGSDRKIARRI